MPGRGSPRITVRVTDREKERVEARAAEAGLSVQAYVRRLLGLEADGASRAGELLRESGRLSVARSGIVYLDGREVRVDRP